MSTDRIGVAAMRGARLQHLLDAAGVPVDRSGVTGRIVEAYPAAALQAWGLANITRAEADPESSLGLSDRARPGRSQALTVAGLAPLCCGQQPPSRCGLPRHVETIRPPSRSAPAAHGQAATARRVG